MINRRQKQILILALNAGELMMKNGAEIYRVEDTITRICKACKIPYVEVFATTTGIFLSLDEGSPESDMHTFIRRIEGTSIDLEKISRINQFSRIFASTDLSIEEGLRIIKKISKIKPYPTLLRIFAAAVVSSFFCLIFNGGINDFICTFFIGALSYITSLLLDKIDTHIFIRGFSCCFLATVIALILRSFGLVSNFNSTIIGSIMIFLPGVAITNAVRDTLAGDMLSGVARAMEAATIAVSLASGVGFAIKLFSLIGGR